VPDDGCAVCSCGNTLTGWLYAELVRSWSNDKYQY
jgi:hypothetical protein